MRRVFQEALRVKPLEHQFREQYQPNRPMTAIGGVAGPSAPVIRANTISPGVVDTPMHANDNHEVLKRLHPVPRLVQIPEIMDALLFVVFGIAPMVNGENVRIEMEGRMLVPSGDKTK